MTALPVSNVLRFTDSQSYDAMPVSIVCGDRVVASVRLTAAEAFAWSDTLAQLAAQARVRAFVLYDIHDADTGERLMGPVGEEEAARIVTNEKYRNLIAVLVIPR